MLTLFCNSIIGIGSNDIAIVINHCVWFNGINLNIFANCGIITTIVCTIVPNIKLPIKYLFSNIPILNIDLWEHAYYLDYQSNRNLYIDNFFNLIDYENVSKIYEENISKKKNK